MEDIKSAATTDFKRQWGTTHTLLTLPLDQKQNRNFFFKIALKANVATHDANTALF